eukprot:m.102957 g.102957  ORF g.102957 m.102957 type:complete len:868 (+) comp10457_c1_seq1:59-2662(+)
MLCRAGPLFARASPLRSAPLSPSVTMHTVSTRRITRGGHTARIDQVMVASRAARAWHHTPPRLVVPCGVGTCTRSQGMRQAGSVQRHRGAMGAPPSASHAMLTITRGLSTHRTLHKGNGFFDTEQDRVDELEQSHRLKAPKQSADKLVKQSHKQRTQKTVSEKLDFERRRLAGTDKTDTPDRIPAEVAEELLKQSEKVRADDDRKRHELDPFWLQRSFPRSTMATLYLSLGGNVLIAAAKFVAYTRTGHSAMLTEAIHTLVDVVNQIILGYGLREAAKAPDQAHQYGYGRAAFFYSLLSALSTFGFGAVYTFSHGVETLMDPPQALVTMPETWAVLGIAGLVDGFVLTTAWRDVSRRAAIRGMTPLQWIFAFRDPFTVAVIFEDSAAVAGIAIAAAGIGMTQLTGATVWDSAATLAIATLLGGVSLKLVQLNRSFIVGRPVDKETTDAIAQLLLVRKSVDAVYDVHSQWIGPQAFTYNADVDFDGTYLAAQVYETYEQEIQSSIDKGTIKDDLKWLLPCFAEDVARVIEREVREIKAEIRKTHTDAAFIEIVPDSSQTASALEGMEKAFRRAEHDVLLALVDTIPGDVDDSAHWSFFKLGTAYQATGFHQKAIGPLTTALVAREEQFGRTHPLTALALERLGYSHVQRASFPAAIRVLERAVRVLEAQSLDDYGVILSDALSTLADAHSHSGAVAKAIDLRVRAADIGRQVYQDEVRIADLDYALAADKCRLSQHREDAYVLLMAVKEQYQDLGETDRLAKTLETLGRLHLKSNRPSMAANCYAEQLELIRTHNGPRTAEAAKCLTNLGTALMEQGSRGANERALECLHEAHQIRVELLPPTHPDVERASAAVRSLRRTLGYPREIS